MSVDEHVSPRAAIRTWLQNTVAKPTLTSEIEQTKQPDQCSRPKCHPRRHVAAHSRRSTSPGTGRQLRHGRDKLHEPESKPDVYKVSALPKPRKLKQATGIGLAERLGLHAPFLTFGDGNDEGDIDLDAFARRPKRRRRASSSSSYLEPVVMDETSKHGYSTIDPANRPYLGRKRHAHEESEGENSSEISRRSGRISPSPEKPSKSYHRRQRHKTREDRYDLKDRGEGRAQRKARKKDASGRQHKPRRRKEKSGDALMHDFAPQNVSHDRLTVSSLSWRAEQTSMLTKGSATTIEASRFLRQGQGVFTSKEARR